MAKAASLTCWPESAWSMIHSLSSHWSFEVGRRFTLIRKHHVIVPGCRSPRCADSTRARAQWRADPDHPDTTTEALNEQPWQPLEATARDRCPR